LHSSSRRNVAAGKLLAISNSNANGHTETSRCEKKGRENTLVDSLANCVPRPLLQDLLLRLRPLIESTSWLAGMSPCGRGAPEKRKITKTMHPEILKVDEGPELLPGEEDLTTVTGDPKD